VVVVEEVELPPVVIEMPGPQGPAGRDGKDGKDGVDGKDGKDAEAPIVETADIDILF
jgi:hypothetical protein